MRFQRLMWKVLLSVLILEPAVARKTEMPPSFHFTSIQKSNVPHFTPSKVDISAIKTKHELAEARGEAPRYAAPIDVAITPKTDGVWTSLGKDTLLWRLKLSSKGAKSLNFGFKDFYLPEGAKLFVYSPDYKHVRGPFTEADNNSHRELWTPVVFGDEAIVEVEVPEEFVEKLELKLTSINHDYLGFGLARNEKSGSCNVDVACKERHGWESQIQSVAVISTGGSTFCTGFLVNNTAQDMKPLFMTAAHCRINKDNAPSLVAYWNYQNSSCREPGSSSSGSSGDGELSQFTTGATFKAGNKKSDFTIVELNSPVDEAYNPFYAGWNATKENPKKSVGIHHPKTHEKRISFDFDPATTTGYSSNGEGDGSHIRIHDWDIGTTEPGSSGSPLFDQDQRVVGQLHGGGAACGNDNSDWYGRISTSWELGLKEVLDPVGTGETVIDGTGFEIDYLVRLESLKFEGFGSNGVADPGETILAKLVLKNGGKKPVTDLAFQMNSDVQGVQISKPNREGIHLDVGQETELTFSIAIGEQVTCGTEIVVNSRFIYAEEKMGRENSVLQTGVPLFHEQASAPDLAIPDGKLDGVSDEIAFSGIASTVDGSELEVVMNIEHTYIGDLTLKLEAPDGKTATLHKRKGGKEDNIVGTYPTTLKPTTKLSVLNGAPVEGTWKLHVTDHTKKDIGKVKEWKLRVFDKYVCEL